MRLLTLLSCALVLAAAFVPARWRYRQRIVTAGPVTRVVLDRAVYDGAAPGLDDLRVGRDGAGEVPYLLRLAGAGAETLTRTVQIVNQEWRAGALSATLELEGQHNELLLDISRVDFRSRVAIEASDDGKQWALLRRAAYIFRYTADDGRVVEETTLRYPDSRRRYVRLTLSDWPGPEGFTGASVAWNRSTEARRSEVWSGEARLEGTRSCAVFATGTTAPRDRAVVAIAPDSVQTFHRSATLEESEDGKSWRWLASGALYRIQGEESLALDFAETRARWMRLCVRQGDDRPVRLSRVQLLGLDRELTFRSDAPGAYWLYYGATSAVAPVYDLAQIAGTNFQASAQRGSLGAREANPGFAAEPDPRPWTEKHPALLYTALGVAVCGLGWVALKLLRTSQPQ